MVTILVAFVLISIWRFEKLEHELSYWAVLVILSQVAGYLMGLSFYTSILILSTFTVYRIWKARLAKKAEVISLLLLGLPFLFTASMPTRFLDAGRYYNQTVRWFIEGVPRGLANFDLYLIQGSGAHSLEALLTSLTKTGYDIFVPLISTYLIVRFIQRLLQEQANWLLVVIIYLVLPHFAQTSSPDLLAMALAMSMVVSRNPANLVIGLVSGTLLLVKLSFAPLALFFLFRMPSLKRLQGMLVFGGIASLSFFKLIWTAGWLPAIGILPVEWSISSEQIEILSNATLGYSEGNRGQYIIDGYPWRWLDTLLILGYVLLSIYYRRRISTLESIFHFTIGLVALLFVPQARFILPLLLVLIYSMGRSRGGDLPVSPFLRQNISIIALCIGLFSVLVPWHNFIQSERIKHYLDYGGLGWVSWLTPTPNWVIETKEYQLGDERFIYYTPVEDFQCFDSQFPCVYDEEDQIRNVQYSEKKKMFSRIKTAH